MKYSYLKRLKSHSKLLYCVIVVFIVITLVVNLSLNQITPFYIWSMYGRKEEVKDSYPVYVLKIDGEIFNLPKWQDYKRMFFNYSIVHYMDCVENDNSDPFMIKARSYLSFLPLDDLFFYKIYVHKDELKEYPKWLKRYMEANIGKNIDHLEVERVWIGYNQMNRIEVIKKEQIFEE